jgi:hypothetical protein
MDYIEKEKMHSRSCACVACTYREGTSQGGKLQLYREEGI